MVTPLRRESARGSQDGFTLLELVAVLALMGLVMALVIPNLHRTLKRERDRADLRQLTTALCLGRSEAANRHQRVRIFLDMPNGSYQLEGENRQKVLPKMRLVQAQLVWQNHEKTRGYVAFYGDGSSSGGRLNWKATSGLGYQVAINAVTGKVTCKTERN